MRLLHSVKNLSDNRGLCALSMNSFLAYPTPNATGELQIYDAGNLQLRQEIKAHDSQISAIAFSFNGMLIATASEKVRMV